MKIKLASDTISHEDIDALCDWLKTYPQLTKGDLTLQLEEKFAYLVDGGNATFVNSGSSANLLMLSALKELGMLKLGDKVGVPALCWSTDLAPILQLGLIPVMLDCNVYHLGIETAYLANIIQEYDIKCILSVSVLGIPPDMDALLDACRDNKVVLLEDNCESLGSEYHESPLGGFGMMSSWSTYFSHHISTVEGGFVTCQNDELKDLLNSIRSHGWRRDDRYLSKEEKNDFQFPYTFHNLGYNIRNTEIGAFLGLRQIDLVPEIANARRKNFSYFCEQMRDVLCDEISYGDRFSNLYTISEDETRFISSFGLPVIDTSNSRDKYIAALKQGGVECRPLIAGNIAEHPVADKYMLLNKGGLINATLVGEYGFYLPNNPSITFADIDYMVDIIRKAK